MIDLLQTLPWLMGTVVLLLGLCIGSFLNVVAWRLPLRMEHEFRLACHEQFGAPPLVPPAGPISLLRPGSHCPACQTPIKPWHNLPVLGWLWLRGRCAACAAPISVQYPLVELATGLLSLACWWVLGSGPALAAALLLTWVLVALTVIDLKTMYLPDDLTLPL
ncbi:MAG TPA: prepilin peptidase, partial [Nevskiaceae bacterium]|nr:prepilin peptidase [Nevskiaceae bacterium]